MTVWVDAWQMQCCGEPFHVGSNVSWTLGAVDTDWLATIIDAKVDAAEEHHVVLSDETPKVAGTVKRISAVHCRYAPKDGDRGRTNYPVPGSGRRTDLPSADGWTPGREGLMFTGYLVRLAVSQA